MTSYWAILIVIFSTMVGALGAFIIKKSRGFHLNIKKLLKDNILIMGISLYALSPILNITAFRWGELTVLYPLITITYIWSSILAVKYLGEKMNIYKLSGIPLIIGGAFLIVR